MDENAIRKKKEKQYSNPAVVSLAYLIAPIGVGIGMLLFRKQQLTLGFALMATLCILVSFGILKPFASGFYIYRKLVNYEKQLGKPIINGLLQK